MGNPPAIDDTETESPRSVSGTRVGANPVYCQNDPLFAKKVYFCMCENFQAIWTPKNYFLDIKWQFGN
jgi:hypothetical protein